MEAENLGHEETDGVYLADYGVTVFRNGDVFNGRGKKLLQSLSHGYPRVYLMVKGRRRALLVHRLLALAFLPNADEKSTVNHINGIKHDNRLENLEWCDQRRNIQHAYDTKLIKTPRSKVNRNKAVRILLKLGWNQREVAEAFDVSQVVVSRVSNYENEAYYVEDKE